MVDLLKLGLRTLLDLAAVRTGIEGDDFLESIGLIDDLRASLSAGRETEADDQKNSESLIERINETLIQANADAADRKQLKRQLETILPGLGGDSGPKTAEMIPFPTPTESILTPDPEAAEDFDSDHALWLGRAKLMQVGNWMLYPSADGKTKPLKLAWVSEEHDRYVFVNRQGHRELEITPTELADQLKGESVDIIDQVDKPLMDRSAQGMMQHMHEQIAHQATHDQLTDALNRKEFERQLRLKLGESKLMQSSHVALQLDIDQFRVINSTAGHDAGDQLLRDVAKLLVQDLPDKGLVARLGGDEFAVLLPRSEMAPGHEAAETYRKSIRKHRTSWKRRKLKSTASIGLVSIDRDSQSVSETLNQLESACAAANDAGGDRVKSYQVDDEEMTRRDRAIGWVKALENALDAGRVELYGQRIISLDENDNKEHYEVLSRLRGADGEYIPPDDFVPAAEAYGRIHLLDEWVFRAAFEALANCERADEIERLSLNVSGKTFSQPLFVQYIKDLLNETGIHASKICFEITETAAISNLSRCTDCLRELRLIGCRFSLDDFGTGLSSFSYLKNLPVDYLKIDGSFVKEIVHSTADYGLVKTINEVGHFLGKKTVGEYVENEEILKRLKEIGLDYAQGFGIAKPKPLNEILDTAPE
jgi:diguanylate cyclase (GGDEF)-like protein